MSSTLANVSSSAVIAPAAPTAPPQKVPVHRTRPQSQ